MKDFAKSAFNAAASIAGGTGLSFFSFFALWNFNASDGTNSTRIALNLSLAAASAAVFALGHNRVFFSGKTKNFIKKLRNSEINGPQ